jgi:hypothetical protein
LQAGNFAADCINAPNDLVAGNEWQLGACEFAIDHMQVGPANATRRDPDAHFAGAGRRIR